MTTSEKQVLFIYLGLTLATINADIDDAVSRQYHLKYNSTLPKFQVFFLKRFYLLANFFEVYLQLFNKIYF